MSIRSFLRGCFGVLVMAGIISCHIQAVDDTLHPGSACVLHDNSPGICRESRSCAWLLRRITNREMAHKDIQVCSFLGFSDIVCCGDERPISTTQSTTMRLKPNRNYVRPSVMACDRYSTDMNNIIFRTGQNGPVALREYPHMAGIYRPMNDRSLKFICVGSIISERFVLTVAHYLNAGSNTWVVRVGHISSVGRSQESFDLDVARIFIHPDYNPLTGYHDIALVKLELDIQFTSTIYPACLHTTEADLDTSAELVATTWVKNKNGSPTNTLEKTSVVLVALAACDRLIQRPANMQQFTPALHEGHLCAFDPYPQPNNCPKDNDGPLQIPYKNGMFLLVGLTSHSAACGSRTPSVYTRVRYYVDWIETIVQWQ